MSMQASHPDPKDLEITRLNAKIHEIRVRAEENIAYLAGAIQPEWAMRLPIQMQSVLLLSTRGADGVPKHHLSKGIVRMYRACVIKAAAARRMLQPGDDVHDTFMDARSLADPVAFEQAVNEYFHAVDELPLHYHLHLVHATEILGYKYPDPQVRAMWHGFYLRCVDDMHLNPETEEQLNQRLNDFGEFMWPEVKAWTALTDGYAGEEQVTYGVEYVGGEGMVADMYDDPSERHDHPIETVCFDGCRGYDAVQAEKHEAVLDQMRQRITQPSPASLPPGLDVAQEKTQEPSAICGQKQGGTNGTCARPKGHAAPHNDGIYVW